MCKVLAFLYKAPVLPYKVPPHFEDLAHFEHDFARIYLCLAVISQKGHVLRKNVTKRMLEGQNGRIFSKNVTKVATCSERRPHQRPSGGRELAGMRKLANKLRRIAKSSKFGLARER